jgi:DNA-binding MarR family transcriptional regulator
MGKTQLSESNFGLWGLIGELSHSIMLIRQKELSQFHIPVRQYNILRAIQSLGPNATVAQVAKQVQRQEHVVSRQTVSLENEGLIKRTKSTRKSTLLTLKVTDKGLHLIEIARHSDSIYTIFSSLSSEERQKMESTLHYLLNEVKKYNQGSH